MGSMRSFLFGGESFGVEAEQQDDYACEKVEWQSEGHKLHGDRYQTPDASRTMRFSVKGNNFYQIKLHR